MKVNYAGTVPLSTLDWTGKSAVTIFFRGCPLRCPYCQNYPYLEGVSLVELDFLKEQIKISKPFVSAVVFSGGEPLMQEAIIPLAEFAKILGLAVGVHTNGCYPERAAELVERKLVDKFFIDVKAPLDDPELYGKVAGWVEYKEASIAVKKNPEEITAAVAKTIETADTSGLELELRTTLIRDLIGNEREISRIAAWISEQVKNKEVTYVLQQGIPEHGLEEKLRKNRVLEREELLELGRIAKGFLEKVRIRTREEGEEII
ncbi:Ribonucleotide reductase of class III (anaerobic), activating protein [Methanosarcina siciliae C2J]|uniref:Ribonucleotide reductase of class III (Anaerobic), activating protein n=3 Tax=Methanosarcina siciliae TaxID=38027 RepID=A0A0E3PI99_9EURY|nr:anaerobic ribonucleoside-triphosphate reductase activating protein [Methanosarcina siciliae]AKB30669.1 Ribonucleotide reductase of class III (anaerobic), activating protein [Methanosarcina siciliae T4/M]AKB34570.1 Ribonucleotide reductase of class III (anaerobic), activating protein [Methanosarcina siciliae HI350]AKB38969.1 Ribonucleotide reductase of class III (anaerobic), activating protein [Methanosarcina siciliae C2J]